MTTSTTNLHLNNERFVVIGINHKTAPIDVREKFTLSESESEILFNDISTSFAIPEAFSLSTCNRTEVYVMTNQSQDIAELKRLIVNVILHIKKIDLDSISTSQFFSFENEDAFLHLFQVATGIDSMFLGESEIMSQFKQAYRFAQEKKFTGKKLNRLADAVITAAKRVRSETKFHKGAISVAFAAVDLAKKIFSDFSTKNILLIGAGETAELTAKYFLERNAKQIFISNRTLAHAEHLSNKIGATGIIPFDSFLTKLSYFDIVISAVSNIGTFVKTEHVLEGMKRRNFQRTLILDLGIPRNVDPFAKNICGIFLKSVDDLQGIIEKNIYERQMEIPVVNQILKQEIKHYQHWLAHLNIVPSIQALNKKFDQIKHEELERLKSSVDEENFKKMTELANRLTNKFLHFPIRSMKQHGSGFTSISDIYDLNLTNNSN
ncbi:hypothetical protein CHS0354_023729 [Potamilus streckersoni]|uniref:Glutamyl-tRNA reductase n=1 Tax=Potamilus streckersoni TaxID=2493646 RepID=A0AAE0VL12_9BIVA|nr:hypothetical protein CHS0354_023729 [Potamilus streckersoni]